MSRVKRYVVFRIARVHCHFIGRLGDEFLDEFGIKSNAIAVNACTGNLARS